MSEFETAVIDRLSTTPYYLQLVALIEEQIRFGTFQEGTRLPSESELGARFHLSRATIRQALQTLEARGLVQRINGRGAFVSRPAPAQGWMIQGQKGFLETALGHGNHAIETRVLRHTVTSLPGFVTEALGLEDGSEGSELVRLRQIENAPALYSINYNPLALLPAIQAGKDVLEGRASLSTLLATAGYALDGAHRAITAVPVPRDIGQVLEIRTGAPVLKIRSVSWRRDGARFDLYDAWVRSDRIPLEVNVSAI